MSTAVSKEDVQHLTHLIKRSKLRGLKELCLDEKSWNGMELELIQLKKVCANQLSGNFMLHLNGEELNIERLKQESQQVIQLLFVLCWEVTSVHLPGFLVW